MALSLRQKLLYIHTCDVYAPKTPHLLANGDVEGLTYPSTPTHTGVKCFRQTTPDLAVDEFYGRNYPMGGLSLMDSFHFEADQDVDVGYALQFTTRDHPEEGQWFVIETDNKIKNYRANKRVCFAKRITKPRGVA